ncbi:MAG: DJ-1/PfpI family protein [Actinobacteria bacterium]|nr:DJ-1/PfpI family protein [Actinomycetota bacterium]MCB9390011.1 DJ-1/PfpI family protein [Acidimicrobiia bacterium]
MNIAIPLFPRVTALDAIGPYEVLQRLPNATVTFVGEQTGTVRADNGFLGLCVDATVDELPAPDIVLVPGGIGSFALLSPDNWLVNWVRHAYPTARFVTSVCTGALVLGAAGLLTGKTATTHWTSYAVLENFGALPTEERFVEHLTERLITAAGVSAGIDMALRLAELLVDETAAQAIQLAIEYTPKPPYAGTPASGASSEVMQRALEYLAVRP